MLKQYLEKQEKQKVLMVAYDLKLKDTGIVFGSRLIYDEWKIDIINYNQ